VVRRPGPSRVGVGQERVGRYCGSVQSIQHGGVKSTLRVTLGTFILGGWPLLFSLEWWGLYLVWGVWLPSHWSLEGTDRIRTRGAVIGDPWYRGILPR
jgi:hypothetical protein